jgi:glutamine amidotransferase
MIPATVIDAGVGNLGNLARALAEAGGEVEVTTEPERVAASRCLLLPGVGAFAPPRERLRGALEEAIRHALAAGAWMLGICVGYQLLFEAGEEFGVVDGLGLLPGRVTRLPEGVPLPHVGWNRLERANGGEAGGEAGGPAVDLLAGLPAAPWMYFVHSFAPDGVPDELVAARALHGRRFAAVAGRGRVLGTQFHPEKSGPAGLALLANFLEAARGAAAGD